MKDKIFCLRIVNKIVFLVGVVAILLFPIRTFVTFFAVADANMCVSDATERLDLARKSKYPTVEKKLEVIASHEDALNEALQTRRSYNHSSNLFISASFARASKPEKTLRLAVSGIIFVLAIFVLFCNIKSYNTKKARKEAGRLRRLRAERAAKNAVREAEEDAVYQELLSCITE